MSLSEYFEEAVVLMDRVSDSARVDRRQTEGKLTRRLRRQERIHSDRSRYTLMLNRESSSDVALRRFELDVGLVIEVLEPCGGIRCQTRRGYRLVHNVSRIVREFHAMGMEWVMEQHVRAAQRVCK
jgi:hypothetical protein